MSSSVAALFPPNIPTLCIVEGAQALTWHSDSMLCFEMPLSLSQAIRVLGLLGALDPYKHKVNIGMIDQSRDASAVSLSESKSSQDSGKDTVW